MLVIVSAETPKALGAIGERSKDAATAAAGSSEGLCAVALAAKRMRPAESRPERHRPRRRFISNLRFRSISAENSLYRLNALPLRKLDRWLETYREFWRSNLLALKKFVEGEETR
jgi:hypothetical protein